MSAYQFGYITGFVCVFLFISWVVLKVVRPRTVGGLNLTMGITGFVLLAGQLASPSPAAFVGCLVSVGLGYFLLYRPTAGKISPPDDEITTLSLGTPVTSLPRPGDAVTAVPSAMFQGESAALESAADQPADRSRDLTQAEPYLGLAGQPSELAAPYSGPVPVTVQPAESQSSSSTRTSAMLVAAIILFINAAILLLGWGMSAVRTAQSERP